MMRCRVRKRVHQVMHGAATRVDARLGRPVDSLLDAIRSARRAAARGLLARWTMFNLLVQAFALPRVGES
jgi:hypothetical protein